MAAKRLAGKVAIITGGARGIGAAAARLFSQHGAKVLIAASIAEEIQSETGHPVFFVECNVSKDSDMQNAVDAAVSMHGKLDIMYNNAGIAANGIASILSTDPKVFREVFDVNVYGSFLAAKHAARVMIPAKIRGNILLTASSTTASYGLAPHSYTASKQAVVGLTKNLCVELGEFGIRVNCISPYAVATELSKEVTGLDGKAFEDVFVEKGNLKGRVLRAKDVAEAALNLVSDESNYISGLNLLIDGGYSLISP
ncbi:Short chain aldehyde dehydrogenase 1 [Linum grandiflorum]